MLAAWLSGRRGFGSSGIVGEEDVDRCGAVNTVRGPDYGRFLRGLDRRAAFFARVELARVFGFVRLGVDESCLVDVLSMFPPREGAIVPLYAARLEDLGPGDLVQLECVCGHTELLTAAMLCSRTRVGCYRMARNDMPKCDEFMEMHGNDPHWVRARQDNHYFANDLRRALAGNESGFREIAIYGRAAPDIPLLTRDLWRAGVRIRRYRRDIKREWTIESRLFVDALGDDLDAYLRDAGFNAGRLPEEFDVWRGGTEPIDVMTRGACWTASYSVACAFAFQDKLWLNERDERLARLRGLPEPLVITRRVRRAQIAAWMGGIEREVVLTKEAIAMPAQPCGCLREWRRHRARRQK